MAIFYPSNNGQPIARSTFQPQYSHTTQFVRGNPLIEAFTPEFVLDKYLTGVPLTSTATGKDLTDIVQQKIDAAVAEFESKMHSFIVPRTIIACVINQQPQIVENLSDTNNPTGMTYGTPAVPGVDYDLLEIPYDYSDRRFREWSLIKAKHTPILEITNILFALPPNFGILIVPQPWITSNPNTGIVQIVPVEGAMAVTSPGAGMWLPFFTMGQMNYVPQFTQMSYVSGVDPIGDDLLDAMGCLAAAKVLQIYNLAYYPGVQSFSNSTPTISQNVSFRNGGPFADTIKYFVDFAYDWINQWNTSHNGIVFSQL